MMFNENLYLNSLSLKNFATFKDQIINFRPGFNAIVGETGSGKSLILDALQLILGQRADKKLIRKDSEFTSIEAHFHCSDERIISFFDEQGFPFDDSEIVIKRIIYSNGKSKSFINFQACNLSTLTVFSKQFIDLVGQFENQKLLSESYQLLLLDRYANNESEKQEFTSKLKKLRILEKKHGEAKQHNSELKQKQDYIRFQVEELENFSASIEDESSLLNKKNKLTNIEKVTRLSHEVSAILNGTDDSDGVIDLLKMLAKKVENNSAIISSNSDQIEEFINWAQDLDYTIQAELDFEFDESEISFIIDRLDLYQKFKRKYNTDTSGLITLFQNLKDELNEIESLDQKVEKLHAELNSLKEEVYKTAFSLHKTRLASAPSLEDSLTKEINSLRMYGASIKIHLSETPSLSDNGISSISLEAQTNLGEGYFKVKEIASGGELSRILLAIRKVVSNQDSISIFLFDEVDSGIGGETALCIGKSLFDVSENSQVIAITHLPQIASFASNLILVDKKYDSSKSRTFSKVTEVTGKNIKTHIKNMIPISQE